MKELSSLISELQAPPRKRKSLNRERTQRPEKNELNDEMEGRLPAIGEDKQWPRLSLKFVEAQQQEEAVLTN